MISIIAAVASNGVIGKENHLPWNIPDDMKHFKDITTGNVVVMGRKNFESIGRALPNRINIVLSKTMKQVEGVIVARSVEEAVEKAKTYGKEIFIIGGAVIYKEFLDMADRMYLSYIKRDYEGDVFFPIFDKLNWRVVERKEFEDFELVVYERQ